MTQGWMVVIFILYYVLSVIFLNAYMQARLFKKQLETNKWDMSELRNLKDNFLAFAIFWPFVWVFLIGKQVLFLFLYCLIEGSESLHRFFRRLFFKI